MLNFVDWISALLNVTNDDNILFNAEPALLLRKNLIWSWRWPWCSPLTFPSCLSYEQITLVLPSKCAPDTSTSKTRFLCFYQLILTVVISYLVYRPLPPLLLSYSVFYPIPRIDGWVDGWMGDDGWMEKQMMNGWTGR